MQSFRLAPNPFAVATHGFGNAWGHYVCCVGPLSKQFNVIAIDWVGNGRSMVGLDAGLQLVFGQ